MNLIPILLISLASAAGPNAKVDITILSVDSRCQEFINNASDCQKVVSCSIKTQTDFGIESMTYKMLGLSADKKSCPVFLSFKSSKLVSVYLVPFEKDKREELSKLLKEVITAKKLNIELDTNCCSSDPKKIIYCPVKVNGKSFLNFFDQKPMLDCKTKLAIPLVKKKTIDYSESDKK